MNFLKRMLSMESAFGLMILFSAAIGAATFIEHEYGTDAARAVVYDARWFEAVWLLLAANLIANLVRFRLWRKEKRLTLLFHGAFLLIIAGAALTRYAGYEGFMHIREGERSNTTLSNDAYLRVQVEGPKGSASLTKRLLLSPISRNRFSETLEAAGTSLTVRYAGFLRGVVKTAAEDAAGGPVLLISAADGRRTEDLILTPGSSVSFGGKVLTMGSDDETAGIRFSVQDGVLKMLADEAVTATLMRERTAQSLAPNRITALLPMTVYRIGELRIVIKAFHPRGRIEARPPSESEAASEDFRPDALRVDVAAAGELRRVTLFGGSGMMGEAARLRLGDMNVTLSYGSREVPIPFALKLTKFTVGRYPGSMRPASFTSDAVLLDEAGGIERPVRIYMNHILRYGGYRFYQSSYDEDERGTVLSVARNPGTPFLYAGTILLVVCLTLQLVHPRGRFRSLGARLAAGALAVVVFAGVPSVNAQTQNLQAVQIARSLDGKHCRDFGALPVLDDGRVKPVHSLALGILRSVNGGNAPQGVSVDATALMMFVYPEAFKDLSLLRIENPLIRRTLNLRDEEFSSYHRFFDSGTGHLSLAEPLTAAHRKAPAARTDLDWDLLRMEEMLSTCRRAAESAFSLFPVPGDPSQRWLDARRMPARFPEAYRARVTSLVESYRDAVRSSVSNGDWSPADSALESIRAYQREQAGELIPGPGILRAELRHERWAVFRRLAFPLLGAGVVLLFFASLRITASSLRVERILRWVFSLMAAAFALQTLDLVQRWFAAGHAPWTNKYESMVFIAWATLLAGLLFARRSFIPPAVAGIWSGLVLIAARMPWADPGIAVLPPVLRSPWLVTHVSVIVTSYGFFGLAGGLGLVVLLLFVIANGKNRSRIESVVIRLSWINERVMLVGLVLVTLGNLFGAVWANESWGRFWGWDPKETWTLVVILVYAAVLHFRLIPALRGPFALNLGAFLAFSTVLMTYIGVNMYLSGLHSYAGGKPPSVPGFLLWTGVFFLAVIAAAFVRRRRFGAPNGLHRG